MSAHSFLDVGGHPFYAAREDYVPDLVALFMETELKSSGGKHRYVSRGYALRDRLQLHGFTSGRARAELDAAVTKWHERHANPHADALGVAKRDSASLLNDLGEFVNSDDKWAPYQEPEEVFWHLDPRTILRLALDQVDDPEVKVSYNLDDLASWKLLGRGEQVADQAREDRREAIARDAPLVILTEGASDSQLLTEAVRITHPHLVGFLRFMDFSVGAEGSAASLAKLVRSFVGAGIANRVIAIADNDTAAHDALEKLKKDHLPETFRLLHYPALPLLANYPTLGPQSEDPILMNVNGRAGSVEMYLGEDVLKTNSGLLSPVQWTGYVAGQKAYQGAISSEAKKRVHDDFHRKVEAALRDRSALPGQDWTGIHAIVTTILCAFDD